MKQLLYFFEIVSLWFLSTVNTLKYVHLPIIPLRLIVFISNTFDSIFFSFKDVISKRLETEEKVGNLYSVKSVKFHSSGTYILNKMYMYQQNVTITFVILCLRKLKGKCISRIT